MLQVDELCAAYGRVSALQRVSLEIQEGEIVALLGANGAGKTTLLRTLSGVHPVKSGRISFAGKFIERSKSHTRVDLGIAQSPEGRQIFKSLSVEDNLRLGAYRRRDAHIARDTDEVYALFPMLGEMRKRIASALSGGQQQMLAIGRALLSRPRLLLLDEPSLGLAPLIIDQIFSIIASLKNKGITVLVVEQNVAVALSIADRGYVLETGHIVHSGTSQALLNDRAVRNAYLGV